MKSTILRILALSRGTFGENAPRAALLPEERSLLGNAGLDLPSIGQIVNSSLTALNQLITTLQSGQTVQNGLAPVLAAASAAAAAAAITNSNASSSSSSTSSTSSASSNCPELAVIFARGTAEPGNMGFLAGPPFATALENYINSTSSTTKLSSSSSAPPPPAATNPAPPKMAIQGLDYAATASSALLLGGSPSGALALARLANTTHAACPSTRLVLSGYSQGAAVVRSALADHLQGGGSAATLAAVSSVVLFGDPRNGTAVPGIDPARLFVACHAGDVICEGGTLVLPQHLNYSGDAPAAAMHVMQRSRLGIVSADAVMQGMDNVPTMQNPMGGLD
jgi:cutinase